MGSVSLTLKFFGLAFSALLPLVNPLGSALVFLGLVGRAPESFYHTLSRRIAINTTFFLLFIEIAGTAVLSFFGISLHVVQVAGGLVLASMGWSLLNQKEAETDRPEADVAETRTKSLEQNAFYPLTFPVTAGPGCIVVMLTLSAHASTNLLQRVLSHLGILLAVIVLSALVYVCYAFAPRIETKISPQTAQGVLRVIAFVLLCIGVQIFWQGAEPLLKELLKS